MKPTQQEIIWVALRAGLDLQVADQHCREPYWTATMPELQKLVELALERFGAGGGEPVALDHIACICDGELRYMSGRKAPTHDCELYAMPDCKAAPTLYTHPSPTDLRAEYLRGLEDAAKVADDDDHVVDGRGYYDQLGDAKLTAANIREAIRALKGKQ